eukprot:TRINITY_DN11393_c0_g2_i1.p1 TRINITY_DN11393_c0_g2~~TRINITY_DN11393_c0_g2_i1.p1  ORF type:complete len:460 (-),score=103.42 TRINITY_DN11393_c0_g2_i1:127-1506(-)
MEFNITDDTDLHVSFSWDPLLISFNLSLKFAYGLRWIPVSNRYLDLRRGGSHTNYVTQAIDAELHSGISRMYKLVLTRQPNAMSITNTTEGFCFPYDFEFQLGNVSSPVIRSVEPISGSMLDPNLDLTLDIQFSSRPYFRDSEGQLVKIGRRESSWQVMIRNILLQYTKESMQYSFPAVEASKPPNNPHPDDKTRWRLLFPSANLTHGTTYRLVIVPNTLFDDKGVPFLLNSVHEYVTKQIDPNCSGFGTFNQQEQKCTCRANEHREGSDCSRCKDGYVFDVSGRCVVLVHCLPGSCGCHDPTSTQCHPIGICSVFPDHPDKILCDCPVRFGGEGCERCNDGYVNYPVCEKVRCSCLHGSCVNDKCVCLDHWTGDKCDTCVPGYSGEHCSDTFETTTLVGLILLVAMVVLVVGGVVLYIYFYRIRTATPSVQGDTLGRMQEEDSSLTDSVDKNSSDDDL